MSLTAILAADSKGLRSQITERFMSAGFKVEAPKGANGFVAAFPRVDADLAILDIQSVETVVTLCKFIRRRSDCPIMVFTDRSDVESVKAARAAGASSYVLKSSGVDQLAERAIVEIKSRDISASPAVQPARASVERRVVIGAESSPFADSLADIARLRGWQVELVPDSESVLEAVKSASPEAVVLDDSIAGARIGDLARSLKRRRQTSDINVIALTPFGSPEKARRNASFADFHLLTPCPANQVIDLIGIPKSRRKRAA